MTSWEEGAVSVAVSSGDCFEGDAASLSASASLMSFLAVRKKKSRVF